MPIPGGTINETPSTRLTPGQIFANAGLYPWWLHPSERFGQSYNGYPEYGTDFGMPYQTRVGSLTSGVVVYAGYQGSPGCQSLGYVVQIASNDGLYHYQHLDSVTVSKGAKINVGDVIGYSGGLPSDNCSSGPHIEVRWAPGGAPNSNYPWFNNNTSIWVDPLQHYNQLAGTVIAFSGYTSTLGGFVNTAAQKGNPLTPNSSVTGFLWAIDQVQGISWPPGIGHPLDNFQNPLNWPIAPFLAIADIYAFLIYNMVSFILNLVLIILGIYIVFKIFKGFVDISTLQENVSRANLATKAVDIAKAAL